MLRTVDSISDLEQAVDTKLSEVLWDIQSAESEASDASSKIDQSISLLAGLNHVIKSHDLYFSEQSNRTRKLLKALKIDDPSVESVSALIEAYIRDEIKKTPLFKALLFEERIQSIEIPKQWVNIIDQETLGSITKRLIQKIQKDS